MEKIFRNEPARARNPHSSAADGHIAWRAALPVLTASSCTLREPVPADGPALLMALVPHDFQDCAAAGTPPTLAGIERFIADLACEREAGTAVCWGIVPAGARGPVGLVMFRGLDHGFTMAGMTAVVAPEFRGTGLFQDAARLALDVVFGPMGMHRLEMRVDIRNARANGALRKLGATQEGVLRHAQFRDGAYRDHVLWAMVAEDWTEPRDFEIPRVH